MNCEAVQQILAQSLLIWTQDALVFTSCSRRSQVAQYSYASAQLLQASIRFGIFDFEAFLALTQSPIQKHIIYIPVILLPKELMLHLIFFRSNITSLL
jgi:hypothetical protein